VVNFDFVVRPQFICLFQEHRFFLVFCYINFNKTINNCGVSLSIIDRIKNSNLVLAFVNKMLVISLSVENNKHFRFCNYWFDIEIVVGKTEMNIILCELLFELKRLFKLSMLSKYKMTIRRSKLQTYFSQ
jgi:hypothetical protein